MASRKVQITGLLDVSQSQCDEIRGGSIGQDIYALLEAYAAHRLDATQYMHQHARRCTSTQENRILAAQCISDGIRAAGLSQWHDSQTSRTVSDLLSTAKVVHVWRKPWTGPSQYTAAPTRETRHRGIYARVVLYANRLPDIYIGQAENMFARANAHIDDADRLRSYIHYTNTEEAVEIVVMILCSIPIADIGEVYLAEQAHTHIFGTQAPDRQMEENSQSGVHRTYFSITASFGEHILHQRGRLPYLARETFEGESPNQMWLKHSVGSHILYQRFASIRKHGNSLKVGLSKGNEGYDNIDLALGNTTPGLEAGKEIVVTLEVVAEDQLHPNPYCIPAGIDELVFPCLKKLKRCGVKISWTHEGNDLHKWLSPRYDSTPRTSFATLEMFDIPEGLYEDPRKHPPVRFPSFLVSEEQYLDDTGTSQPVNCIQLKPLDERYSQIDRKSHDISTEVIETEIRNAGAAAGLAATMKVGVKINIGEKAFAYRYDMASGKQCRGVCNRCLLQKAPNLAANGSIVSFEFSAGRCVPTVGGGCQECRSLGVPCTFIQVDTLKSNKRIRDFLVPPKIMSREEYAEDMEITTDVGSEVSIGHAR